jgi:Predicted Zn-dependent peptidases
MAGLNMSFLSEYFDKAAEILADVTVNPAFDASELEVEKENTYAALKARKDSIGKTASDGFLENFYEKSPYAFIVLGKEESLKKITPEDLSVWHKYSYNASNILISIAGNIDKKTIINSLEKYFGVVESGKKFEKTVLAADEGKREKIKIKGKFNQAYIFTGFNAPELKDEDFVAIKVMNAVLGGRMTSRLFVELREKLGLAYEVGAIYPSRVRGSFFAIYIGLDKKNIDLTLEKIDEILQDICTNKISEQELKDTKTYIKGIYIMDRQTVGKQSYYYGWREIVGQGYRYEEKYLEDIDKISIDDINKAANRIFKQKPLTVIIEPDEK